MATYTEITETERINRQMIRIKLMMMYMDSIPNLSACSSEKPKLKEKL
jgi:hypothetical protein